MKMRLMIIVMQGPSFLNLKAKSGRLHALWERYHGCHMDALREWMEFVGTLSWLPHGCSVGMDRVCGNVIHVAMDVIMVGTWMLCGNG